MPETPNHSYNVPNEGDQDWHEPLNENFEQYDTDIEIRDEGGNRSNYDPVEGAKFYATDTGGVWLGDGSNWVYVDSTGPVPSFEQVHVEDTTPLLLFRKDGEELTEFMTEESQGFARFQLSLYDESGSLLPVLSADRDEHVGIGVGSPDVPLEVGGGNNWDLDNSDGDVRIGDSSHRLSMGVALGGVGAGTSRIRAKGGTERLHLGAGDSDTLTVEADGASVDGDFDVSGNKNFVQAVDTDAGEREVVYTATESATPHTEACGVAELEDGRAEVDLPEHFGWVTSDDDPLVVQVTPHARVPVRPQVTERSTDRIVVEDVDGVDEYEVSYTVKGTREGHADKEVVRAPRAEREGAPTDADGTTGPDSSTVTHEAD